MKLNELEVYIFKFEGFCSDDEFLMLSENFLKSPLNLSASRSNLSSDNLILSHEKLVINLYNRHLITIEGTIIDLVDAVKCFDEILPNYSKFYLSPSQNLQEIDDYIYCRNMSKNEIFLHLSTFFDHKLYIY